MVDASSKLAVEVFQHMLIKSTNCSRQISFPDDFNDFRGHDQNAVITNNSDPFIVKFGATVSLDLASAKLYDIYSAFKEQKEGTRKLTTNQTENDLLDGLADYFEELQELEHSLVWD